MRKNTVGMVLFLLPLFIPPEARSATPLTQEQQAWLAGANRHEKNGWIYVHIQGAPEERGFQYGYLLAEEIKSGISSTNKEWYHATAMEWSWLVQKASDMFKGKIDAELLAELTGISEGMKARGASTSVDELIAYNGYIELSGYWWPEVKDSLGVNALLTSRQSCSSFIAVGTMTADGGIVLGHNTMFMYYDPLCNVILDILPEKGHRILMQTIPGWIHSGTDFFITDAGLIGSETTISPFHGFDPAGIPEFIRMRRATQDAATIDQWCEIMKRGNNGGYANAWLLGDINSNEIARLELGLKFIGYEKKKEGYFTGSNVAEDLKILRFESERNETDIRISGVARRVRWNHLMNQHKGKINVELAKLFEADHYDSFLKTDTVLGRSLCAHWELDPASFGMTPYIPEGTLDAKVVDSKMARQMTFLARWGSACGRAFDAKKFLEEHPQFLWMSAILHDRPTEPWTEFKAGER